MQDGIAKNLFKERTGKAVEGRKAVKWPVVDQLVKQGSILYFDYALADLLVKGESEAVALGVIYLSLASRKGHLCLSLASGCLTPSPEELFDDSLPEEVASAFYTGVCHLPKQLVAEMGDEEAFKPFCRWNHLLYLQKNWVYETLFLDHYLRLDAKAPSLQVDQEKAHEKLSYLEESGKILHEQRKSIDSALQSSLSVISGGPGTGKSYTAGILISLLQELTENPSIILTAPTGKAAARLQSCVENPAGCVSKTLHSLLGIVPGKFKPIKESQKLSADFILVDEASMIDIKMFATLFSAVKTGTRVVLLGDPHQLPPVESGQGFGDLLELRKKQKQPVGTLTKCLRAELQGIIAFASAINRQDNEALHLWNFEGVVRKDLTSLEAVARDYVDDFQRLPKDSDDPDELLSAMNQYCILSPFRQGEWGAEKLNEMIMEKLGEAWKWAPIMIQRNDPSLELYNGDVGFVKGKQAYFSSKEGVRSVPLILLPHYDYAFCISVHKSQGSEYQNVKLMIPPGTSRFGKKLLYTGATRAKKRLECYGSLEEITASINAATPRCSGIVPRALSL